MIQLLTPLPGCKWMLVHHAQTIMKWVHTQKANLLFFTLPPCFLSSSFTLVHNMPLTRSSLYEIWSLLLLCSAFITQNRRALPPSSGSCRGNRSIRRPSRQSNYEAGLCCKAAAGQNRWNNMGESRFIHVSLGKGLRTHFKWEMSEFQRKSTTTLLKMKPELTTQWFAGLKEWELRTAKGEFSGKLSLTTESYNTFLIMPLIQQIANKIAGIAVTHVQSKWLSCKAFGNTRQSKYIQLPNWRLPHYAKWHLHIFHNQLHLLHHFSFFLQ